MVVQVYLVLTELSRVVTKTRAFASEIEANAKVTELRMIDSVASHYVRAIPLEHHS